MEFGVPREVRDRERRVGLAPAGVLSLTRAGHTVYMQHDAGDEAGFSDEEYREAGAQIVYSADEAYGRADVVVKVARPTADEYELFRPGQTLFSFLYLPVASPDLVQACQAQGITAIAYEMMQEPDGRHPVLIPTSEVAGRLAPVLAGRLLMNDRGGRGILLSGIPGAPPAAVVILGGGVLGVNAARAFMGMGAQVTVLDRDLERLQYLDELYGGRVTTTIAYNYNTRRAVGYADVLVGAIQRHGVRAPTVVTRDMVQMMRPGSVVIDFSITSGGCIETSRPTSLRNPTYVTDGVIHYCVPNVTSTVARTASYALNNAVLPYLRDLGEHGRVGVIECNSAVTNGVNIYEGKLANADVAAALGRAVEVNLPAGEPA